MPNPNLSETKDQLADLVQEAVELRRAAGGSVTTRVFEWLVPQYAVAAREQAGNARTPDERWMVFRQMAFDLAPVRRGEIEAERLVLECERLAFDRARAKANTEKERWKWTKRADVQNKLYPPNKGGLTKRTLRKIERELNLL